MESNNETKLNKFISKIRNAVTELLKFYRRIRLCEIEKKGHTNLMHYKQPISYNSKCKQVNKYVNRKRIFKNFTRYGKL